MKAFIKFNKGMLKMPLHWQLWLLLLVTANVVTPFFFLHRLEARVVLGTILASMTLNDADSSVWLHAHCGSRSHLVDTDAGLLVYEIGRHPSG